MIPAFERAKTVHALDRAATVIGTGTILPYLCLQHVRFLQYGNAYYIAPFAGGNVSQ
jgi:hypothetical protein